MRAFLRRWTAASHVERIVFWSAFAGIYALLAVLATTLGIGITLELEILYEGPTLVIVEYNPFLWVFGTGGVDGGPDVGLSVLWWVTVAGLSAVVLARLVRRLRAALRGAGAPDRAPGGAASARPAPGRSRSGP